MAAAGNYTIALDQFTGNLTLEPVQNGLRELLAHYGIDVAQSLVMDPQNQPFPVPITRDVGGVQVQQIQAIDYPFFPYVRKDGMDTSSPIVANLPAVTMQWSSPITLDGAKNNGRTTSELLRSTVESWLRTNTDLQPNTELYPPTGFAVEGEQSSHVLGAALQGAFQSYFKDNPIQPSENLTEEDIAKLQQGRIDQSPENTRLVVLGSAEFVDDAVLQISSSLSPESPLQNLQLVQNAVDWSVEDLDLLGIRARGVGARVLPPMTESDQTFWEAANYGVAVLAVLGLGLLWYFRRRREKPMELVPPPTDKMEA